MSLSAEDKAFLAKIGQEVPTDKKPTAAKKDEE